jgi:hypothetical protein
MAYEDATLGAASEERAWASDVVKNIVSLQAGPSSFYNGGDWFAYPAPFPSGPFTILAGVANDISAKGYANRVLQLASSSAPDWVVMLFRDPNATAQNWTSSLDRHALAVGAGLVTARADWSYVSTWVAFQLGKRVPADHQSYAPGNLQIQRGDDDLLINANAIGNNQCGACKSTYSNVILVDDNGDGRQTYRRQMGYNNDDQILDNYEATAAYVYAGGHYEGAYYPNNGGLGSATKLTRQIVYFRPDYVVVHDRVETYRDSYLKQLQWYFKAPPSVNGDSFVVQAGSSKLFGRVFSNVPLTTSSQSETVSGAPVYKVLANNASPTTSVRYLSAFQTAASNAQSMVSTTALASVDGGLEGVQEGGFVAMFGTNGQYGAGGSYSIANTGSSVTHVITDLVPLHQYSVTAGGAVIGRYTASSQGVISFVTGSGITGITVAQ